MQDLKVVFATVFLISGSVVPTEAQTGGDFVLTKTVIANGGGTSTGADFAITSTTGQALTGVSAGQPFAISSGFWTCSAPVLAVAGGRVSDPHGRGITNAVVTLTFPTGEAAVVITGRNGLFQFGSLPVGGTFTFSVSSRRFTFPQPSVERTILADTTDVNFVAGPVS